MNSWSTKSTDSSNDNKQVKTKNEARKFKNKFRERSFSLSLSLSFSHIHTHIHTLGNMSLIIAIWHGDKQWQNMKLRHFISHWCGWSTKKMSLLLKNSLIHYTLPAISGCGTTLSEDASKTIFHSSLVFWHTDIWARSTLLRNIQLLYNLVTQIDGKVFFLVCSFWTKGLSCIHKLWNTTKA
jgi:hypothetical protein